jgi:hypothetical protein
MVALKVCGDAIVPVDVGGPVVDIGMIVPVGETIGLVGNSVTEALVGLAGGRVGGGLARPGVMVLGSVGEGTTDCVTVATWTAVKGDHRWKLFATSEGRAD